MDLKIQKTNTEGGTNITVIIRTMLSAKQGFYLIKEYGITEFDTCVVDTLNRELVVTVTIYEADSRV